MSYTREQIARAALEAGVGAEKIKQMLKYLGDTTALRSNECAGRQAEAAGSQRYEPAWSGKVLKKHPSAICYNRGYWKPRNAYYWQVWNSNGDLLGCAFSASGAWADAVQRLAQPREFRSDG